MWKENRVNCLLMNAADQLNKLLSVKFGLTNMAIILIARSLCKDTYSLKFFLKKQIHKVSH